MRSSLLAALAILSACGGKLRLPSDGGADSSTDRLDVAQSAVDAGGGDCPARVAPGLACAPGTRPCLGDDRCNDCFCTAGTWVCGSRVCVDSGTCPSGRPSSGDPCGASGQSCSYGAGCAGAECLCAGGRWTCDAFFCGDP